MILSKIDKELFDGGKRLPLIEEFYSIQGEGYNAGKAAYFIRVGGCDICCEWCDSKVSWDPDVHKLTDVKEIAANASQHPAKAIVVTGGEPSTYNLTPLCEEMKQEGIQTFIETAGVHEFTGEWDWVCLSPKKHNAPKKEWYDQAHELKVIISDLSDLEWAEESVQYVGANCKLFLQPEWSAYQENIAEIVEYVKNNPKWNISLQSHKFMHIP